VLGQGLVVQLHEVGELLAVGDQSVVRASLHNRT
jgi:hypothetical protein